MKTRTNLFERTEASTQAEEHRYGFIIRDATRGRRRQNTGAFCRFYFPEIAICRGTALPLYKQFLPNRPSGVCFMKSGALKAAIRIGQGAVGRLREKKGKAGGRKAFAWEKIEFTKPALKNENNPVNRRLESAFKVCLNASQVVRKQDGKTAEGIKSAGRNEKALIQSRSSCAVLPGRHGLAEGEYDRRNGNVFGAERAFLIPAAETRNRGNRNTKADGWGVRKGKGGSVAGGSQGQASRKVGGK